MNCSHNLPANDTQVSQIHKFRIKSFFTPTFCDFCSKFLHGLVNQGVHCDLCNRNYHKKCALLLPPECDEQFLNTSNNSKINNPKVQNTWLSFKFPKKIFYFIPRKQSKVNISEVKIFANGTAKNKIENEIFIKTPKKGQPNQITVQRITERLNRANGFFWKGYILYSTNRKTKKEAHYWLLDNYSIYIYETCKKLVKVDEIPLNVIQDALFNEENYEGNVEDKGQFTIILPDREFYGGTNLINGQIMNKLARNFFNILKMVHLPYKAALSTPSLKAPKFETRDIKDDYICYPEDLIGSGMFGQVYGGVCKTTKKKVAIKIIQKTKIECEIFETSIFQNEFIILQNVSHAGIVKLFAIYEQPETIFIVQERLYKDLLDAILSNEKQRLGEQITKFIIYQILNALEHLHQNNIVHCDLKPENTLLVDNSEFPQVKICDFGFAKIIGENSVRKSIVGTPAYSPPEVREKRPFDKSIDVWSIGIIAYVCLSGVFPFDDSASIYDQIKNFKCIFPSKYWNDKSKESINFIQSLLQVAVNRRITTFKAMRHEWFVNDNDLYYNLLDLEEKTNEKWLITKEFEDRWDNTNF